MKKLLLLISLSIVFLAACEQQTSREQPTSFGGITPGQTTREDLKSLVKKPSEVGTGDYAPSLMLKQPDGSSISVNIHNNIVYQMKVSFILSPELKQALIEKYGQPRIKVGEIRTVKCGNKLGASFERLDGEEELKWSVKDGVQGALRRWAVEECAEFTYEEYWLRHVATVQAIENAKLERQRKVEEEKRQKLGNAY